MLLSRCLLYETNMDCIFLKYIINNFATHNLPLFHCNLIIHFYTLSRTQCYISKYKQNFQDRNYRIFSFQVKYGISAV